MKRNLKYLVITLLLFLGFGGYQFYKHAGLKAYKFVGKNKIPIDSLSDGKYEGSFTSLHIIPLAKVKYEINKGELEDFSILFLMQTPFSKVKDSIQDSVYKSNSLKFDAVTGATRTSYFVKAAIHKAAMENSIPEKND
jgi:uncharacterized protein with FMN-binding domain